ncbi:NAD-dependent succinate-semialdehyde dehydrogenase [Novipirellula sp. SH528]|uniref:NAD-dependent succinate-semialdehyde dehydrogenase n=1 Tax=Novipirellula sp. SH528 TaxID=3454466 RepID=UPI003FA18083
MLQSELLKTTNGFINGRWCGADSNKTMPVVNPATGDTIAIVPVMGRTETELAIESAAAALATPSTIDERRRWLSQLADLITEHREELGRIITHEHGKPWKEAQGEADYAASFFRYYSTVVDHLKPRQLADRPRGHQWTVYSRPAGVVALVTPWNFPLAMLAKKFSAALAADCSSVVKPSSKTPLSMVALFSLMEQIELPPGKANLILGPAGEISDVLCAHPAVRVISFTGSTPVGKKLMAAAAPHLKRLSLELGGNAPFIVFDDADLEQAVDHAMSNKFRGSGQTCVCANRLYVQSGIADAFATRLAERATALRVGDGMQEGTEMGPLIDQNAFNKVRSHVDDAINQGATRIAGSETQIASRNAGWFHPPTVLRGVTANMLCVRDETFGPVAPIIEFASEQEVIDAANATEYGLAAYVFTADDQRAERVISRLQFGHVGHNTGSGPTAEAPFGGMKQSGFGREGGLEGLHDFIETQTVPRP